MAMIERGQTHRGTDGAIDTSAYGDTKMEGLPTSFPDVNIDDPTILNSGRLLQGRIMRNVSGFTVYAGHTVIQSATAELRNKRFIGYTATTAVEAAGVVDPWLGSGGCRNGDMCNVFQSGPCPVLLADTWGSDVVIGDFMYAVTGAGTTAATTDAGKVVPHTLALTFTATQCTDGTQGKVLVNNIGRAMVAATSGNKNTMKLVDLVIC
jgi:hypothetical protein